MKCKACDVILTDFESTRKYANTTIYIDLCNKCYRSIEDQVPAIVRIDLLNDSYTLEEAYEPDYVFKEYE